MSLDTSIPLDNHPDAIAGEGKHLDNARGALSAMYETWSTINRLSQQVRDKRSLANEAQQAMRRVTGTVERQLDT